MNRRAPLTKTETKEEDDIDSQGKDRCWYSRVYDTYQADFSNEIRALGGKPNPDLVSEVRECCRAFAYSESKPEFSTQEAELLHKEIKSAMVWKKQICNGNGVFYEAVDLDCKLIEDTTHWKHNADIPIHLIAIREECMRRRFADVISRNFAKILENHERLAAECPAQRPRIEWKHQAETKTQLEDRRLVLLFAMHVLFFKFEGLKRPECQFVFFKMDELGDEADKAANIIPVGVILKADDRFVGSPSYATITTSSFAYAHSNPITIDSDAARDYIIRLWPSRLTRNYEKQAEFQYYDDDFGPDGEDDIFEDARIAKIRDDVDQEERARVRAAINRKLKGERFWDVERVRSVFGTYAFQRVEIDAAQTNIPRCSSVKCFKLRLKCCGIDTRCKQCRGYPDGVPEELTRTEDAKRVRCQINLPNNAFWLRFEEDTVEADYKGHLESIYLCSGIKKCFVPNLWS